MILSGNSLQRQVLAVIIENICPLYWRNLWGFSEEGFLWTAATTKPVFQTPKVKRARKSCPFNRPQLTSKTSDHMIFHGIPHKQHNEREKINNLRIVVGYGIKNLLKIN